MRTRPAAGQPRAQCPGPESGVCGPGRAPRPGLATAPLCALPARTHEAPLQSSCARPAARAPAQGAR